MKKDITAFTFCNSSNDAAKKVLIPPAMFAAHEPFSTIANKKTKLTNI
jgi:hypothetical protein